MSSSRQIRRALERATDLVSELPSWLRDELREMFEAERQAPDSSSIARFIEEEGKGLNAELKLLINFDPPVTRGISYKRLDDDEFVDGNSPRWVPDEVLYMPPQLLTDGLSDLRAGLDAAMGSDVSDDAVSVWITPFEASEDKKGFFLFFRDRHGAEALYAALGGPLRRIGLPQDKLERFIHDVLDQDAGGPPGLRRLGAELGKVAAKKSLEKVIHEGGEAAPSEGQWQLLVKWMTTSEVITHAFAFDGMAHGTSILEEGHQLLRLSAHAVREFIDRKTKELKEALESAEKNHEKKLHRLRSDLAKLEMLFQGVKARADRADAENRELRKRVKTAERSTPSPAGSAQGNNAESGVSGLRQSLDGLFN